MCCVGCADTKARIWTLRDDYGSTCETTLEPHPEELYCSEWLHLRPQPDNNHFLTASGSVVKVWDLERSTQLQEVPMQSGEIDGAQPGCRAPRASLKQAMARRLFQMART